MKNRNFLQTGITLLLACLISSGLFGQTVTLIVGEVQNGTGVVTNVSDATRVLKGGLSAQATVSNIEIIWEQETGKYYLVGRIGNETMSAKAVQLVQEGAKLAAATGPGVQIDCVGYYCNSCYFAFRNWVLTCLCGDSSAPEWAKCNMTYKLILSF